jgi:hypothetical protein
MMELHPDKTRWTAQEAKQPDGDTVYLIKRYSPFMNDPTKPAVVYTIDPQKGFLVTEAVAYSRAGNVWITMKTEPKEIGAGIWFPASYQEHHYGKPTDAQAPQESRFTTIIQLEDISINNEIPDDYFVIESILPEDYRESTTLFRKGLDGNTEAYIYIYGSYVSRKVWANIDHAMARLLLKDPDENMDVAEKQETARQSEPPVTRKDQAPSEETQIPLAAKDDDKRLTYLLFLLGLPVVVLLIFLSKFGKQMFKSTRKQKQ